MGAIAEEECRLADGARSVVLARRVLVGEADKLPPVEVELEEGRQSTAAPVGVDVDPALIILGSKVC